MSQKPQQSQPLEEAVDYTDFLNGIAHPRRKALAVSLIAGEDINSLIAQNGKIRVQEMQAQIKRYKDDPKNYHKYKGSCLTCGQ